MRADEWRLKMSENVDRVLARLNRASDRTTARFTRMQSRIDRVATSLRGGFGHVKELVSGGIEGFRDEMVNAMGLPPKMAGAFRALTGPVGIAIGLAGALTMSFAKGVQAAEAYNVPFRYLRNLNLDKTKEELDAVNDRVLSLSWDKGLDPTKLVAGVAEVQSTIGEFGPDVEAMVARIGVASRALGMDFETSVTGISKAMSQFRLPLSQVDELMTSNAKTVNLGVVSFDQLSKVQTEFAGAAASANQQVDTANKVFALLTTNTKNADIAATMAKAAFQDLGRKSVVDAFRKIGVNVFDTNGGMRQADQILRDLIPRFEQMSDQQFAQLKEAIGGSEGLRGLLDMTKASGEGVLRVLDGFDRADVSVGDAIERAKYDLDIINATIDGKMQTAWVRLGQAVMPIWVAIKQEALEVIDSVGNAIAGLARNWSIVFGTHAERAAIRAGESTKRTYESLQPLAEQFDKQSEQQQLRMLANWRKAAAEQHRSAMAMTDPADKMDATARATAMTKFFDQQEAKLKQRAGKEQKPSAGDALSTDLFTDKKSDGGSGVQKGVESIVGGGKQVRNVNVRIDSLVKELTIRSANVKEGSHEVKRMVEEALVKAVQGSELTLAND